MNDAGKIGGFTPGPWVQFAQRGNDGNVELIVIMPAGRPGDVASVAVDTPEDEANARLIAAAPDLLEAMKGIEHFSDAVAYRSDPLAVALRQWIAAGQAAILKAEGR
jgi:hypothetical protein